MKKQTKEILLILGGTALGIAFCASAVAILTFTCVAIHSAQACFN